MSYQERTWGVFGEDAIGKETYLSHVFKEHSLQSSIDTAKKNPRTVRVTVSEYYGSEVRPRKKWFA